MFISERESTCICVQIVQIRARMSIFNSSGNFLFPAHEYCYLGIGTHVRTCECTQDKLFKYFNTNSTKVDLFINILMP